MPDLSITDSAGTPIGISKVDVSSTSSIYRYLKSELFHLAVAPDFIARKDQALSQAAPNPTTFELSVQRGFQLGKTTAEVNITPGAQVKLSVNATAGSDLFKNDSFRMPATVPAQTGYVGLSITGSLDLGFSGSSGDVTFGIDQNRSITMEYLKAFPTGRNEPALGGATAAMLAAFVIPGSIADLRLLGENDVCCVSGQGKLKIRGGVTVTMPVNPLASVNLPLGAGTISVRDGVMAGLSASLTLSGSYQIRVQKLTGGTIRLSYLKDQEATFETDLTASAGVSVKIGDTDLLATLLGAIETGTPDPKLLGGLTGDEIATFNTAIKAGIDHSLKASVDLALSTMADNQTAFQYEINFDLLDANTSKAVELALKGDLTSITMLEEGAQPDGTIAPGLKLLNSVLATAKTKGVSLKVNLVGIINLISLSKLIGKCEFVLEPASGDLTIKETAQSERISAITDPSNRQEALRKALFYSVLATTTYVVGKTISMPSLSCQAVHFAVNQNTNKLTVADYTNWFVALNLMGPAERAGILAGFSKGGPSTCIVRAQFDNALCEAMFFNGQGSPRSGEEYLEIGRRALQALLDPADSDIDRGRYQFLDNAATWAKAVKIGPSPELHDLVPLPSTDPQFPELFGAVKSDVYDIVTWAGGMQNVGQGLQRMRAFLSGRDPASLANDPAFAKQRNALQKLLLDMVGLSKVRFHEPWGLLCLFRAAGSRRSSGKLTARGVVLDRNNGVEVAAAANIH